MVTLDVLWLADLGVTWAADGSWLGGADWVGGIEPLHVGGVVVPDGHGENHWSIESLGEARHAAGLREVVQVAKDSLLLLAEVISDLVGWINAWDVGDGVGENDAVLDIEALDALERTGGGVISCDELSDDGDLLGGVHLLARAEEGGVAHAVRVEVASILVANAGIAVSSITAVESGAASESVTLAGVRSIGSSVAVGFPDVHLGTAGSVAASTAVYIVRGRRPVEDVGLKNVRDDSLKISEFGETHFSVDELHVVWTLSITISGTVAGTSFVARVLGLSSVGIHLGEVESSVDSAGKIAHVDIEGELVVFQGKGLVSVVIRHEINSASNVGTSALGDELESQSVVGSGDTVSLSVFGTLKSAVAGAGDWVWAKSLVPGVASVAIGVTRLVVKPSPVGIENDFGVLGCADAARGASLHCHRWMDFWLGGTDLLAADSGQQRERGKGESVGVHLDGCGDSVNVMVRMKKEEILLRVMS